MNTTSTKVYPDYLHDESGMKGIADALYVPRTTTELCDCIEALWHSGTPVTVQGARTGLSASAVPSKGVIVSCEQLTRIEHPEFRDSGVFMKVETGASLADIQLACARSGGKKLTFAPDPTEATATIGGAFAMCARGPNAHIYGSVPKNIEEISVLTQYGPWDIRRGQYIFDASGCLLPNNDYLALPKVPTSPLPGLCAYSGMDLIDLFAGSEGMLGIITSLTCKLCTGNDQKYGFFLFFSSIEKALDFSDNLIAESKSMFNGVILTSAELLNRASLELISRFAELSDKLRGVSAFPKDAAAAVYIEMEATSPCHADEAMLTLLDLFTEHGGRDDDTWASEGPNEIVKYHNILHSLTEAARALSGNHCLQAAIKYKPSCLRDSYAYYSSVVDAFNLYKSIRCSLLSNSFLINVTFKESDLEFADSFITELLSAAIKNGDTPFSNYGIGKLIKLSDISEYPENSLELSRRIKNYFDPHNLLNPGNMF